MTVAPDYLEEALESDRERFVAACPFPFLVGKGALVKPSGPQQTIQGGLELFAKTMPGGVALHDHKGRERAVLLAVRKVQSAFPTMITVGRTGNNDLVISDVQMSKFHAFFRLANGRAELVDAGSRNGTFVRGKQVGKEGAGVASGDTVRFARLEFYFYDAASAWEVARKLSGQGTTP